MSGRSRRIAGIDEAGKGPVLGPMCIAGVVIDEDKETILKNMGVRDSKKLTPKRRSQLSEQIKRIAVRYYILEVDASQIDELRKVMTMNEIMVLCHSRVLNELNSDVVSDVVYLDAADVNALRFGKNVAKRCEQCMKQDTKQDIQIISEHEADAKYPVVSAASILAKVRRDQLIEELKKQAGIDFGSGYPSDRKTIQFLKDWIKQNGKLPGFARSSWETSKRLLENFPDD